jgi:hypothetical protein
MCASLVRYCEIIPMVGGNVIINEEGREGKQLALDELFDYNCINS